MILLLNITLVRSAKITRAFPVLSRLERKRSQIIGLDLGRSRKSVYENGVMVRKQYTKCGQIKPERAL
jgi:hypothetical protein